MARKPTRTPSKERRVELSFLEGLLRRCPDDPKILKPLAELYTQAGRAEDGLRLDRILATVCPEESEVWYNLGCSYALTGRLDQAFEALEKAVGLGYADYAWMARDKDLAGLRDDPRFQRLVAERDG